MATSRIDGVKAPQHFKTPRSHAHARVEEVAHVVEVVEGDEIRTEGASQQSLARRKHAVVLGGRERAVAKKSHRGIREPPPDHRRQEHQFIIVDQYDISFLVLERDGLQIFLIGLDVGLVQIRSTGDICR